MPTYNTIKDVKKEIPQKDFTLPGKPLTKKFITSSHNTAMKDPKKHTHEDLFGKKQYKNPKWFFTTEGFHFYREKGVNANYDITLIDHISLHILAHSMKEALDILEKEIQGQSRLLQDIVDDINRLLQRKNLHEQHNLSWIRPLAKKSSFTISRQDIQVRYTSSQRTLVSSPIHLI